MTAWEIFPTHYKASSPPRGFPLASKPTHAHPSRLGRSVLDLAEQLSSRRRCELCTCALGLSKVSSRVRGEFLRLPVFFFRCLALGVEESVIFGELPAADNGATARGAPPWRPDCRAFPPEAPEPSHGRSRAENRRYLFGREISLRVPE